MCNIYTQILKVSKKEAGKKKKKSAHAAALSRRVNI